MVAGRPKKKFSKEQIQEFADLAYDGCQYHTIASITGVDEGTLKNHFSELLKKKRAERKRDLRRAQGKQAERGSIPMISIRRRMFFLEIAGFKSIISFKS